jgi:hypothetical protein
MSAITLAQPRLERSGQTVVCSADVRLPERTERLWFEAEASHGDKFSSETADGFVVALLGLAATRGLDIEVEGQMSSRLLYSLNSYYSALLASVLPEARRFSVKANRVTRTRWGGTDVYTGFSGGVDSYCTIVDHLDERVPAEYRVTQLLFNNVGSHGQTARDLDVFRARFAHLAPHARALGLPFFWVNSNLDAVLGLSFQLTHTPRNAAVALLLQKSCAKYLYSSAVHYRHCHGGPAHDISYADGIGLPLLSTETVECISSGSQHTRFEKTEIVSRYTPSYDVLDVCIAPVQGAKINCTKCWKCLRTALTLDIIGALDSYQAVFDLDTYRRLRTLYLAVVLTSRDPLELEIKRRIIGGGYPVPVASTVLARCLPNRTIARLLNERTGVLGRSASSLLRAALRRTVGRWAP